MSEVEQTKQHPFAYNLRWALDKRTSKEPCTHIQITNAEATMIAGELDSMAQTIEAQAVDSKEAWKILVSPVLQRNWEQDGTLKCVARQCVEHFEMTIAQLTADLAAANAIVEKLPKTKDGVVVVPGLDTVYRDLSGDLHDGPIIEHFAVWHPLGKYAYCPMRKDGTGQCHVAIVNDSGWYQCYSTPEAAEAARKGGE